MSHRDGDDEVRPFDPTHVLRAKGTTSGTPGRDDGGISSDSPADRISRWHKAPFPLLVCMNFRHPRIVRTTWERTLEPLVESIGSSLRVDWATPDWVGDMRLAARDAAFVLMDLTEATENTLRELRFLFREDIPVICYAHTNEEHDRLSIVGSMYPDLALSQRAGSIDEEILSHQVFRANYEDEEELAWLCDRLKKKLVPFRDTENPISQYYDTDTSRLDQLELDGLVLARIPRSRIIGSEGYWQRAQTLFSESAIYRTRVWSWLADEHLQISGAENLWIREHLLGVVRREVASGRRLSGKELAILRRIETTDPVEDVRFQATQIRWDNGSAADSATALRNGLPAVSQVNVFSLPRNLDPVVIQLALAASGEIGGLRASEWSRSIAQADVAVLERIASHGARVPAPRTFQLQFDGTPPDYLVGRIGQIEDKLDDISPKLARFAAVMTKERYSTSQVATFIRATVSLVTTQEIERLDPGTAWGAQYHDDLIRQLSRVWDRPPSCIRLFEFSSSAIGSHFRGLFPWPDVKELVIRTYTSAVSEYLPNMSKDEIFKQAMQWDVLPAQLWDISVVTEMNAAVSAPLMRKLWSEYVLPSALLYFPEEMLFVSPEQVDRWAYVV